MWVFSFFKNMVNGRKVWLKKTENLPNVAPIFNGDRSNKN